DAARPIARPPEPPPTPAAERQQGSFVEALVRRVEQESPITAVYLQRAKRVEQTGDTILIVMPDQTGLALLDNKEHKAILNSIAAELVGKAASVSLIIEEQRSQGRNDVRPGSGSVESAKEEPLVKRFLEAFRGDIVQIKPANNGE